MADMTCIYEMNMLEENEQLEQDILAGRGMEVLFCLMDKLETKQEIARQLGMPIYAVQLYLQRLRKAGLIKEKSSIIQNGQSEKRYELVSNDIEIINYLQSNTMSEGERKRKAEVSAQHFAVMVRNAVKNVNINADKPHKIKSYFMKAKKEDMEEFCKEIDALFEKYQSKEDLDSKETYSLFTVLAPYEMEE
ncbi:MAG: hypothetical protein ACI4ES_07720 [Roseburia sp.]